MPATGEFDERLREALARARNRWADPSPPVRRMDGGGGPNRVWRVEGRGGPWVLKAFGSVRAFEQARRALWALRGSEALRERVPRVVESFEELQILGLSWLPGRTATLIDEAARPRLSEAAGEFLAGLHALPVRDDDPVAIAEALARRWERALEASAPELNVAQRRAVEARWSLEAIGNASRVWCHRDFAPYNWHWEAELGRLHVFDFEHARLDYAPWDLVKLYAEPQRWGLSWEHLLVGYRRVQPDFVPQGMDSLVALYALATVAWARRNRAASFLERGLAMVGSLEARGG